MMGAKIEELFRNPAGILSADAPGGDVAISSRIRLARNPEDRPFPRRASDDERRELASEVTAALPELAPELEAWARLRREKRALEAKMAETENRLKARLGEAERGECGRFTVLWKTQTRKSFQAKDLAKAHPELDLAPFWRETETRVLRISEGEETVYS